jgi:hypothetical protein
MKRIALAAAVAVVAVLALRAGAQTTPTSYTFVTVDEVRSEGTALYVTGILDGEATSTTARMDTFASYTSGMDIMNACERKALMAMAKPGQYQLKLTTGSYYSYPRCTLTRVNP